MSLNSSRRGTVWVAVTGALLAAISILGLLPRAAGADTDGTAVVVDAELVWGVKASFLSYLDGSWSEGGEYGPYGGDVTAVDGGFAWGDGLGTASAGAVDTEFSGGLYFYAHGGVLDVQVENPRIVIDGDEGTLIIDALYRDGEEFVSALDVEWVSLDLSEVEPTVEENSVTYTNVPTTMLATGAPILSSYPAGTEMDPITFSAASQPFGDLSADNPFIRDISWLVGEEVSGGYPDGTFRPTAPVSRQQMAAFLWRIAGEPVPEADASFSDVAADSPFADAIAWLVESEITGGYPDGTFRPGEPVTRQQLAAFLWRAMYEPDPLPGAPTFPDVDPAGPFGDAVSWLADAGVVGGYPDGTFRPGTVVSRQTMAAFLHRMTMVVV